MTKNIKCLYWLCLCICAFLQSIMGATPATWKIICIGDSITQGVYNLSGQPTKVDSYRYELYKKLVAGGFRVDFIGRREFPSGGYTHNDYLHDSGWDYSCEGWAGRTSLDLIDPQGTHPLDAKSKRFLIFPDANSIKLKGTPDIALIHIGTNDNNRSSMSGNDVVTDIPNKTLYTRENTIRNITTLVNDRLRKANPRIKIFLAQIIPTKSKSLNNGTGCIGIQNLNSAIGTLARELHRSDSPVYLVDQYTGYNSSHNFDTFHPTTEGDAVIAAKWYDALRTALTGTGPGPEPVPDIIAPSKPTGLKASSPSNASIKLQWSHSTDNVGVIGYEVYRNGVKLPALASGNAFVDTGLAKNTTYGYVVKAKDAAGNPSLPSDTAYGKTLSAMTFVKAVNLNGTALTISGNAWTAYAEAITATGGLTVTPSALRASTTLAPVTEESSIGSMLNSAIYTTGTLSLGQAVANGDYQTYLWVMENHLSNYRSFDIQVQGNIVESGAGSLAKGSWKAYGPYGAHVTNGVLSIQLNKVRGEPHLMGISIFK